MPPGADGSPVTWRSLLLLGVSGGLLPPPALPSQRASGLAGSLTCRPQVFTGPNALVELIDAVACDAVVCAVVGIEALPATFRAVELGRRIALANKEVLVMAGALGTFVGAITQYRISARVSAALLLAAYFVLVNLPRLLLLTIPTRLLVEMILPLVLPVLVTWLALAATERALTTD